MILQLKLEKKYQTKLNRVLQQTDSNAINKKNDIYIIKYIIHTPFN